MIKNKLLYSVSFGALLSVTGCQQEYYDRYDGVTTHAGNQLAVNEALMVEDPWKRKAYDTNIEGDGKRQADIVKKYRDQHKTKETGGGGNAIPGLSMPVNPPSQAN